MWTFRTKFLDWTNQSKNPFIRALRAYALPMHPFVYGTVLAVSLIGFFAFRAFLSDQTGSVRWLILLPLTVNLFPWFFATIGFFGALFDEVLDTKSLNSKQNQGD